jgi:hypothetical protein
MSRTHVFRRSFTSTSPRHIRVPIKLFVIITWSFGRFTFETMAPISMLSSGLHAPSSLNHQPCFTVA